MRSNRFTRRSALQMLGMGAAASMLPRGLRRAHAQNANIPTRIVFFYTNHGSYRPAWLPVGVGGAAATETAYDFGEIMQPLAAYKKDILIVDGLDMLSSDVQTAAAANAHIRGHCHSMTSKEMADANLGGGISIDQHIAQFLNKPTPLTALPSLEIGVDPNSESRISFAGASQQLPIESNPNNTFKRLFPSGAAPSSSMPAVMDKTPAQQKSVLDFVAGDFAALAPKLGADDRMKLQAHADAVRDMETRLTLTGTVTRSCTAPQLVGSLSRNAYSTWYQGTGDNFMRLIQAAFACDLTRVVTFNMEAIPDDLSGYTAGAFGSTDMHDLIHKVAAPSDAASKNPAAVAIVKQFHTQYAKQLAKLLGYLAAIPESDGSSVLSHTIVLHCGEIAEGGHDLHQLPWLIAGQGGGAIRTGRYLKLARTPKAHGHNDLYVALANAMGSPITTFGTASVCQGALPGLA
jgi:hypothetical protein